MMKKALLYSLSAALLLTVVLAACRAPGTDQPAEPREPDPSVGTPADTSAPEQGKDTAPEPKPEQTPAAPAENEDAQPPEDTTPQEPAQEQPAEPPKETEPDDTAEQQTQQQQTAQPSENTQEPADTQQQGGGSISLKDAAEQQGVQVTEQNTDRVWDQAFYDSLNPQQQAAYENADDATRTQMKSIIESNRQMDQQGYTDGDSKDQKATQDAWGNIIVN